MNTAVLFLFLVLLPKFAELFDAGPGAELHACVFQLGAQFYSLVFLRIGSVFRGCNWFWCGGSREGVLLGFATQARPKLDLQIALDLVFAASDLLEDLINAVAVAAVETYSLPAIIGVADNY